jgi:hypothetical protein
MSHSLEMELPTHTYTRTSPSGTNSRKKSGRNPASFFEIEFCTGPERDLSNRNQTPTEESRSDGPANSKLAAAQLDQAPGITLNSQLSALNEDLRP